VPCAPFSMLGGPGGIGYDEVCFWFMVVGITEMLV
jgi:hypothetical protein